MTQAFRTAPTSGPTRFHSLETPIGELMLLGDGNLLTGIRLPPHRGAGHDRNGVRRDPAAFAGAEQQLRSYFAGELERFDLALAPRGTEFQLAVWAALLEIPYGTTASYGEIARAVGHPERSRAVGAANARNPISIVVPCHRVIGANGHLTGYAGGLHRKQALLELEGASLPLSRQAV
jgi:methylated-DNA-[protein]-cysteine S-methyltransferase